jgi:ABC-type uncharacterized transport system involved in gliding motility auxiliary subunit
MERKTRARTESAAFIAIVAVALVLVNILAIKVFARIDMTKRKLFTLSEGTQRIVRHLNDQMTITVYFTPNQPPPANDDERFLRDQLDEYRSLARGHITVRYVTPDNDSRKHDAEAAGCVKAPLQAVNAREQQATIQEVYRCVTFEYLGRRDKIEFLPPDTTGLEYEISSIIKNLTASDHDRERTIGFLTGHGELTPDEGMQYLSQLMEQERVNYHTRTVNLSSGDVPNDIKGLIIANPTQQIPDAELRKLDAYLMHGGAIAVFASGVNMTSTDPTNASGGAADHHLNDWLNGYGFRLDTNVILDPRSTDAPVRVGRQMGRVRLVTWPLIAAIRPEPTESDLRSEGGLDPSFPAVFRLPEFTTIYPSTLSINREVVRRGGGTLRMFAFTGPRSIQRTSDFDLNIIEILQQGRQLFDGPGQHGPFVVGAALTGPIRSAYATADLHENANNADAGAALPTNTNAPQHAPSTARIMVISSGNLLALEPLRTLAQMQGGRPGNLTLLFNTFDWLSQDSDLLAVRAKDTTDPTLRADISDTKKQFFQWGMILLLPFAIGAIGFAVLTARRARRRGYARDFGGTGSGDAA